MAITALNTNTAAIKVTRKDISFSLQARSHKGAGHLVSALIHIGHEIVKKAIQKKFLNLDEAYVERLVEEM